MSKHKSKYWYVLILTNARYILQLIVNGNLHELLVTVRNAKMRISTKPNQTLSLSLSLCRIATSWHPSRDSRNMKQSQWSRRWRSGWRTRKCSNSGTKTRRLNFFRRRLIGYVTKGVQVCDMNYGISPLYYNEFIVWWNFQHRKSTQRTGATPRQRNE